MQKSLVASLAQLIMGCWIRKSAFLLYRVGMASAICKQLKKNGRHRSFVARFGKMTRTQQIDEWSWLLMATFGRGFRSIEHGRRGSAQTKTRGRNFQPPAAEFSGAGHS
jgi:hypothetical protein